jgi:3-dehydroquinate synthetase
MGMHLAARMALRLGWVDQELVDRQEELLRCLQLPVQFQTADARPYLDAMRQDKKVERDKMRLILPRGVGTGQLHELAGELELRAIWENHE